MPVRLKKYCNIVLTTAEYCLLFLLKHILHCHYRCNASLENSGNCVLLMFSGELSYIQQISILPRTKP